MSGFFHPDKQEKRRKRIYLAGKIGKNDWRTSIVPDLASPYSVRWAEHHWPILTKAIFGAIDYVGPYFVSGSGINHDWHRWFGEHRTPIQGALHNGIEEGVVIDECFAAIDAADLVFAWIDAPDAYGTLVELGYAKAKGKLIVVGYPDFSGWSAPDLSWENKDDYSPDPFDKEGWFVGPSCDTSFLPDMWFAFGLSSVRHGYYEKPDQLLHCVVENLGWLYQFESPLEESFWLEWRDITQSGRWKLSFQHKVFNYRLDFAHVPSKVAIELDGITYHSSDNSFEHDRQRDRRLAEAGWTVLRFTGNEIRNDVAACARQSLKVIQERSR